MLNPFNFPAYWAAYLVRSGKPVVWTCSEVLGPYRQTKELYEKSVSFRLALNFVMSLDRRIVKNGVDSIVTYSTLNRQLIMERYERTSKVIPACVDFDFFSENVSNAKERLGFKGSILLLHVGWLVAPKNHVVSIRALHILKEKKANIKLVIVGTGPLEPFLRKEADYLGLKNDVIFMDVNSQEVLRLLYHACDLNLFPVKNQTFGLIPFEALAAGKISIVAKGAGAAEIIRREKIGFLIEPTIEELANVVLFALSHPEDVNSMVRKGQKYVRENLTWEKYARDMLAVFKDALCSE